MKGLFYQGLTRDWENVYVANPGNGGRISFSLLWFLDPMKSGMLNLTEFTVFVVVKYLFLNLFY